MIVNIKGYDVLIDDEDYAIVKSHSWQVNSRAVKRGAYYFEFPIKMADGTFKGLKLHRVIMGCEIGDPRIVDHINRNTLDNRKCNLRFATKGENVCNVGLRKDNPTGYKGVHKFGKGYNVHIAYEGKKHTIRWSTNPTECARWYDAMAIKLHGEFAYTNFPRSDYTEEYLIELYSQIDSPIQNNNTTGYRGVYKDKRWNGYQARIGHNKKDYYLGYYNTPEEAARAYDKKAVELHGNRARLNFPEGTSL